MIRPGTVVSAAVSLLLIVVGVWLVTAPRFGDGRPIEGGHMSFERDVSDDARDAFIQQIKLFGGSNGFKVQVRAIDREGRHFDINMLRPDIQIGILNPFDDGHQFRIVVWHEVDEPARLRAEALVGAFKEAIDALQGITPHVRKPS
jgi:hypothetical protein